MKPSELLHAAGDLVARPGGWTQGSYARDKNGNTSVEYYTGSQEEASVCWCAKGAILRIASEHFACTNAAEWYIRQILGFSNLIAWNDEKGRTQEEVVTLFRKAEQLAKDQGG